MCMCCPDQTHYVAYGSNTCNKGLGPFLFYPRRPGVLDSHRTEHVYKYI